MISYLYDGLYDFKFFFTGFPDKSYWASEFGAFDMLYALLGFRFGIFFMIVFFLFVVLFSKKAFRGAELFVFLLFLIGTSGTMAGIFHTRYGVAWAWIITFCYVTSKQMRRVNDGKS
ncbi:hypothetical protein OAG1_15610 [Agarivorans sp. OAG1]|nr:hypothetical protein OAG1_15610 [Agarivorans sp. OAG1]